MNAELEKIKKLVDERWAIEAESDVFDSRESKNRCIECGDFCGCGLCDDCEWMVYEGPNGVKI